MKYPFHKKSFWIILSALSLPVLIFHLSEVSNSNWSGHQSLNQILVSLIFWIIIIVVLDYLGHVIFSIPETK